MYSFFASLHWLQFVRSPTVAQSYCWIFQDGMWALIASSPQVLPSFVFMAFPLSQSVNLQNYWCVYQRNGFPTLYLGKPWGFQLLSKTVLLPEPAPSGTLGCAHNEAKLHPHFGSPVSLDSIKNPRIGLLLVFPRCPEKMRLNMRRPLKCCNQEAHEAEPPGFLHDPCQLPQLL